VFHFLFPIPHFNIILPIFTFSVSSHFSTDDAKWNGRNDEKWPETEKEKIGKMMLK
jgi:hypothetical protein